MLSQKIFSVKERLVALRPWLDDEHQDVITAAVGELDDAQQSARTMETKFHVPGLLALPAGQGVANA